MAELHHNPAPDQRGEPAIWPVWATLVAAPVVLGVAFLPVVVYFAGVRGYEGPALMVAVEHVAAGPATVGFSLILLLTWRALVRLRARYGVLPAVVVSSVFYALLTPGPDAALKIWALALGIVLSTLRLWTGSLWPVVAAHLVVSLGPRAALTLSLTP